MGHTGWWAGSCEITPPDRGVQHHPRHPSQPVMGGVDRDDWGLNALVDRWSDRQEFKGHPATTTYGLATVRLVEADYDAA